MIDLDLRSVLFSSEDIQLIAELFYPGLCGLHVFLYVSHPVLQVSLHLVYAVQYLLDLKLHFLLYLAQHLPVYRRMPRTIFRGRR